MVEYYGPNQALINQIITETVGQPLPPLVDRDLSTPETTAKWLVSQSHRSNIFAFTTPHLNNTSHFTASRPADNVYVRVGDGQFWGENLPLDSEAAATRAWYRVLAYDQLAAEGTIGGFTVGRAFYLARGREPRELIALFVTAPEDQRKEIAVQISNLEHAFAQKPNLIAS